MYCVIVLEYSPFQSQEKVNMGRVKGVHTLFSIWVIRICIVYILLASDLYILQSTSTAIIAHSVC